MIKNSVHSIVMEQLRSIKIIEDDYIEVKNYAKSKHLPLMIVLSRAIKKYLRNKKVTVSDKSKN